MNKKNILEDKIVDQKGLTFDDLLLLPNYSDFKRQDVNLTVTLHPKIILKLPVISSPMDTVTENKMAVAMAQNGGLGIIHRNLDINKQTQMVNELKQTKVTNLKTAAVDHENRLLVGAAVGVGADFEQRVKSLIKAKTDVIVVDSGHGHSKFIINAVIYIKKNFKDAVVMAGNVATSEGTRALIKAGTDIVRVGMGPGSICTTRIITGMGVPQLTAVIEAVKATSSSGATVVADGGIRQVGDIAKALAFGADCVMLGSLLARYDEAPGKVIIINNKKYKAYRGMGSIEAMKKGGAERYGQSRNADPKKLIAEGVGGLVEYDGKVADYLYQIAGGLRSSFYYLGSKNIKEFFKKSKFIRISNAGLIESHPHSVVISDTGGNYKL